MRGAHRPRPGRGKVADAALPKQVPRWLRQLALVKVEGRGVPFPHSPEEGLRQCAALSALSLRLLREEIRKTRAGMDDERVEIETSRLLARFAHADALRVSRWKRERARSFRQPPP